MAITPWLHIHDHSHLWMIALMEPVLIGLMGPLETPSNQGLGIMPMEFASTCSIDMARAKSDTTELIAKVSTR